MSPLKSLASRHINAIVKHVIKTYFLFRSIQVAIFRSPDNPIIRPEDVVPSIPGFEVVGVFNAAVTKLKDEIILLLRVAERPVNSDSNITLTPIYDTANDKIILKEFKSNDHLLDFSDPRFVTAPEGIYLTSISNLRVARSKNGIDFKIDPAPALAAANEYEEFGLEDPRITFIDDTYYITYVAVGKVGITTCLASTKDFKSYKRHGVIFCPDNRDVVIFNEKVNDKYYALHRPVTNFFKSHDIWIAESDDLVNWGDHRYLAGVRPKRWDEFKTGAGAPPFRIEQGWLEIYHGADNQNRYCLGALLLDAKEPWKVIARSQKPVFAPQADYECNGFFGNVIFTCGLIYEEKKLKIYYGAADTSICYAEIDSEAVLKNLNL